MGASVDVGVGTGVSVGRGIDVGVSTAVSVGANVGMGVAVGATVSVGVGFGVAVCTADSDARVDMGGIRCCQSGSCDGLLVFRRTRCGALFRRPGMATP